MACRQVFVSAVDRGAVCRGTHTHTYTHTHTHTAVVLVDMNRTRWLVAVASTDPTRCHYMTMLLKRLALAQEQSGAAIDVHLDLQYNATDLGPLPSTLRVSTAEWDASVSYGLTSKHHAVFRRALEAGTHNFFLFTEDDLHIGPTHLDELFKLHRFLANERALFPTLRRYEYGRGKHSKLLSDASRCCPPQIREVKTVHGHKFIVPWNQYAAMYTLTRAKLAHAISKWETANHPHAWDAFGQKLRFLRSLAISGGEWGSGLWMDGLFTAVVPAVTFERFLVHHEPNNIAQRSDDLPSSTEYVETAACYRGTPLTLPTPPAKCTRTYEMKLYSRGKG